MCSYLTGLTGYPPLLSGRTAAHAADDPRTSSRRLREGDTAVPVCVGVRAMKGPWGGGGGAGVFMAGAHLLSFSCGLWLARVGGLCVPGARGPSSGAWVPYPRLLRESLCSVTCSFLQPRTEPQRGARGVWSEVLLD